MKSKKTIFKIFLAFLIFVVQACATNNVKKDDNSGSVKNTAMIVVSATHEMLPPASSSMVTYSLGNEKEIHKIKSRKSKFLFSLAKSEFDDVYGRLHVIELEQGKYKLLNWSIKPVHTGTIFIKPLELPDHIEFEVKAGEIVYIGNLHMNLTIGGDYLFGASKAVRGGSPIIKNEQVRDLDLFREKYPELAKQGVIIRVPHEGGWL